MPNPASDPGYISWCGVRGCKRIAEDMGCAGSVYLLVNIANLTVRILYGNLKSEV